MIQTTTWKLFTPNNCAHRIRKSNHSLSIEWMAFLLCSEWRTRRNSVEGFSYWFNQMNVTVACCTRNVHNAVHNIQYSSEDNFFQTGVTLAKLNRFGWIRNGCECQIVVTCRKNPITFWIKYHTPKRRLIMNVEWALGEPPFVFETNNINNNDWKTHHEQRTLRMKDFWFEHCAQVTNIRPETKANRIPTLSTCAWERGQQWIIQRFLIGIPLDKCWWIISAYLLNQVELFCCCRRRCCCRYWRDK